MNKHLILSLLLSCFFCFDLSAQKSIELEVRLNSESASSESYQLESTSAPFTGITAYVLEEQLECTLEYQIQTAEGWQPWQRMHAFDHGETPGRTTFEGSFITQAFGQIRFRSNSRVEPTVVFRLYFPQASSATPAISGKKATGTVDSCDCPPPPICDRSCWCPSGNCPQNYTPQVNIPTHLIIHHSAGSNNSSDYAAVVAYIWDFHVNTNGWDDVGYNWLIDPDGQVYEGRGQNVLGAHFSCMNSQATGICMLGNFMNYNPTVKAKQSLQRLLAFEGCGNEIDLTASSEHEPSKLTLPHIAAHRDANNSTAGCPKGTVCPGDFLYAQLPSIRQKAADIDCYRSVGQSEFDKPNNWSVYPNPTRGKLRIEGPGGKLNYDVLSGVGELLLSGETQGIIDLSALKAGYYILKLRNAERERSYRILLR